ncbi:MAG: serine/threonine protein kinase [Planctomycetaceae bacterium]|nr:serine/threonine protein kinase [Planctomycetaceae bacterium]
MEHAAASEDSWSAAGAFLKDDVLDQTLISRAGESASVPYQIQQVIDALGASDDPAMLGRLAGYEISGVIGSGGMGVVLKAHDRPLDRIVAIKVLAPHLATSGAARQRFSREARAAAAVLHPNVIAIHGVNTDAALPFLVMTYVGGTSLQKRLDQQGALPVVEILQVAWQLASGLAAAHEQGLVHRDIKPANILLDQGVERLVITDFGLARAVDDASMTRTGIIAGTPQYMSPEQAGGESIDSRSDLFSLGSVIYTMCTGRPPFRADSPFGVLRMITDRAPRAIRELNPDIPDWLCSVVEKLHCKDPDERFQSARELADVLAACLAHVRQPLVNALPEELRSTKRGRVPLMVALGVVLSIGLLATGYAWWNSGEPHSEAVSSSATVADDSPAVDKRNVSTKHPDPSPATDFAKADSQPQDTVTEEHPSEPGLFPEEEIDAWDDQLDPVLNEIQRSLENMQSL